MSLQPEPTQPVPEETARVARAAFPKGNRYLRLRDSLGPLYTDAQFADLFAVRGRPAESPRPLAGPVRRGRAARGRRGGGAS